MPSHTARPTKPASVAHRPQRLAWLVKNPKNAAAYLQAAMETGDPGDLLHALREIADAR